MFLRLHLYLTGNQVLGKEMSQADGIHLPQDWFSPSINQDTLETAGLSQVYKRKKIIQSPVQYLSHLLSSIL